MNILGIETSSIVCSVGLVNDRGFSVERSLIDPHIHSEKLLTLMGEVLKQSELSLQNIDAVAVSIGPGSFTGLRIGLSTAKGICYSLVRPLIVIPTFESIARLGWEDKPDGSRISILLDAKQGEFYFASQGKNERSGHLAVVVRTIGADDIRSVDSDNGEGIWITDRTDVVLNAGLPASRVFEYVLFCGGKTVAAIGLDRYRRNDFADLASTEPMYLKEFVVKQTTR